MNDQVLNCRKRVFNCHECDDKSDCNEWNEMLKEEQIRGEDLLKEMPLIIKYFGVCGLKQGNIEKWKKKLEELAFGC